jgi:hypothetical protein
MEPVHVAKLVKVAPNKTLVLGEPQSAQVEAALASPYTWPQISTIRRAHHRI